jgi:hypothetical protein
MIELSDAELFAAYRRSMREDPAGATGLCNEIHRRYGVAFELWLIRARIRWAALSGTDRNLESIGTTVWRKFLMRVAAGYEPQRPDVLLRQIAEDTFNGRWRIEHRGVRKAIASGDVSCLADDSGEEELTDARSDLSVLLERAQVDPLNRSLVFERHEGFSYAELAERHRLDEEAVRSRVRRTLEQLRSAAGWVE